MATTQSEDPNERVSHPRHYNQSKSGIECIELIEHLPCNIANAVKYVWRCGLKSTETPLRDLESARWYTEREAKRVEIYKLGGEPKPKTEHVWCEFAQKVIASDPGSLLSDYLHALLTDDFFDMLEVLRCAIEQQRAATPTEKKRAVAELEAALDRANAIIGQQADEAKRLSDEVEIAQAVITAAEAQLKRKLVLREEFARDTTGEVLSSAPFARWERACIDTEKAAEAYVTRWARTLANDLVGAGDVETRVAGNCSHGLWDTEEGVQCCSFCGVTADGGLPRVDQFMSDEDLTAASDLLLASTDWSRLPKLAAIFQSRPTMNRYWHELVALTLTSLEVNRGLLNKRNARRSSDAPR